MSSNDYTKGIRDFYLVFVEYTTKFFRDIYLSFRFFRLLRKKENKEIISQLRLEERIHEILPIIANLNDAYRDLKSSRDGLDTFYKSQAIVCKRVEDLIDWTEDDEREAEKETIRRLTKKREEQIEKIEIENMIGYGGGEPPPKLY